MISVFVCKNSDDLKGWHWKAGPQNTDTLRDEPVSYKNLDLSDKTLLCHARSKPTPSMVLMPVYNENENHDVLDFIQCIKDDSANEVSWSNAMQQFIGAMREAISICPEVESLKDAPLCVFIHFGGENFDTYNDRLHKAWMLQDDDVRQRFLCFAITRHGSSGDIINQDWCKDDEMFLPDTNEKLMAALEMGCKIWNIELPKPFTQTDDDSKPSSEETSGESNKQRETTGAGNPSSDNGKTDDSPKSMSDEDPNGQVKIRLNARSACVLKLIVAIELVAGFILSWVRIFFTHSFTVEFGFGVLGLVFLVIPVILLWNAHEDDPPTKPDSNNELKKALGLPEEADEAKVLKTVKKLKSRVDKQQHKDSHAEVEQFANANALKSEKKTMLKMANHMSPEAAKVLVAGISAPQATSPQDNS